MKELFETIRNAAPAEYRWMFTDKAFKSMSYDCNNPESFGELKPKPNWRLAWRNRKAEIYVHGGHIGKIIKAEFIF
jgi:hypothetical protein